MIHLSRVLQLSEDGKPHDYKIISKGNAIKNRDGGYVIEMSNTIVTSSCHKTNTRNLRSLNSGQTRKIFNILIIEFDGVEVFL